MAGVPETQSKVRVHRWLPLLHVKMSHCKFVEVHCAHVMPRHGNRCWYSTMLIVRNMLLTGSDLDAQACVSYRYPQITAINWLTAPKSYTFFWAVCTANVYDESDYRNVRALWVTTEPYNHKDYHMGHCLMHLAMLCILRTAACCVLLQGMKHAACATKPPSTM
jgi:hypothetical protein